MLRSAEEQERLFREWLSKEYSNKGTIYSPSTVRNYINKIKDAFVHFVSEQDFHSPFDLQSLHMYDRIWAPIMLTDEFKEYDDSNNRFPSSGFKKYEDFLKLQASNTLIGYGGEGTSNYKLASFSHNRIIFGAPGTGKSYKISQETEDFENVGGDYERVTFHPDYSYANFVGVYKPIPCKTATGEESITYGYVPGPFMRTYIKAVKEPNKPFLLIIEEINRANMAAVFGDIFQLLDRQPNGDSMYPIQTSEDLRQYLKEQLGKDIFKMIIPRNMYIWATMNSADQGVYPMDTAFKRRWNFEYIDIDAGENVFDSITVEVGCEEKQLISWNDLRKAINEQLISFNINEDKLLGPFFVPYDALKNKESFSNVFKYKVLMYLFEDAARQKRRDLFTGCSHNIFSKICKAFDEKGVRIFCDSISSKFANIDESEVEE